MIELFSNTPLYAYWIFFSLLFVGILQTKERKQGLLRALIIPFILIFFSVYALFQDFSVSLLSISSWVIGILFIIIMKRFIKNQDNINYSSSNKVFTIKGSYIPLFLMMLLFFTKYSITVLQITSSSLLDSSLFIILLCLLYGIFTGVYILRLFVLINKVRN